ncbi:MAG: hypothetical protein EZS28_047793, partial [Streblomastix strix]
ILTLIQIATQHRSDQSAQITNLAVKILAEVGKHGIKLEEGASSLSTTKSMDKIGQIVENAQTDTKVDLPELNQHPFEEIYDSSGATTSMGAIFKDAQSQVDKYKAQRNNSVLGRVTNQTPLPLSDGTDMDHPEEQMFYTSLASATCIILFQHGKTLKSLHQKALEVLVDEVYPERLERSKNNPFFPFEDYEDVMKKRLDDASTAIIALGYILRFAYNHIVNINFLMSNLKKYMNLYEQFPQTDIKNSLVLLTSIVRSAISDEYTSAVFRIMDDPVIAKVRCLQNDRKDSSVFQRLNALEIAMRCAGFQQKSQSLEIYNFGGLEASNAAVAPKTGQIQSYTSGFTQAKTQQYLP